MLFTFEKRFKRYLRGRSFSLSSAYGVYFVARVQRNSILVAWPLVGPFPCSYFNPQLFQANSNTRDAALNEFGSPFQAQYVKLHPEQYVGYPALRWDFIACLSHQSTSMYAEELDWSHALGVLGMTQIILTSALTPTIIWNGQMYSGTQVLPSAYRSSTPGTLTANLLVDGDLGSCLQFPMLIHGWQLHVMLPRVPNGNLTIHGQGFDCKNILVGEQVSVPEEDWLCASDLYAICSVDWSGGGESCQSETKVGNGVKNVVVIIRTDSAAKLCEMESEMVDSNANSIIPPFDINQDWDGFLDFLKGGAVSWCMCSLYQLALTQTWLFT